MSKKTDDKGNVKKFGNVNKKQFDMMLDVDNDKIFLGYIINFRKKQNTYYLSADQVLDFIVDKSITRKSIPETYCINNGIKLKQEIRKTRYNYFKGFLDEISEV